MISMGLLAIHYHQIIFVSLDFETFTVKIPLLTTCHKFCVNSIKCYDNHVKTKIGKQENTKLERRPH